MSTRRNFSTDRPVYTICRQNPTSREASNPSFRAFHRAHSTAENDPSLYARCGARASPRFHAAETRQAPQQNDADRSAGSLLLCGSAQSVLAVRLPASSLGHRAAVKLPQASRPLLAAFRHFAFSRGAVLFSSGYLPFSFSSWP